jgi:hypothetical protein
MSRLAPWYYRNVVDPKVGPIDRLVTRQIDSDGGRHAWEALAYLHPNIRPTRQTDETHVIYGNVDGTGTSTTRSHACHKAISEALERWAWLTVKSDEASKHDFGLDVDPSTSGFAAWPGPFVSLARKNAYHEAAERWSLTTWWMGGLQHRIISDSSDPIEVIEILTPCAKTAVVVIHGTTEFGDHVYGFAGGSNVTRATKKAKIEFGRNATVLTTWKSDLAAVMPQKLLERRLVYFAGEEGHRQFAERSRHGASKKILSTP